MQHHLKLNSVAIHKIKLVVKKLEPKQKNAMALFYGNLKCYYVKYTIYCSRLLTTPPDVLFN